MVPHHEPLTSSPNVRTGPVMFLSVLSCRYGGGHQRVAETIAAEWTAATGGRADVVDYFARFTSPTFDALTRFWYYQAIRYTPAVQDRFYQYMGRIRPDSRFRRAVNRQGMAGSPATWNASAPTSCAACTGRSPARCPTSGRPDGPPSPASP